MGGHVTLLGDSIFDNGFYVPGGPSVIEHVRRVLPRDWNATLVAVDGAKVLSVFDQIARIPAGTTHLVLSIGGNDALWAAGNVFGMASRDVREALVEMGKVAEVFRHEYAKLIAALRELRLSLTVCTIYNAVPGLDLAEQAGLSVFNDTITQTAFQHGIPVIDLRVVCNEVSDYAAISPIEPSASGGGKIARAIVSAITGASHYRAVYV